MSVVDVALAARSYPILIQSGLLSDTANLRQYFSSQQIVIITNKVVAQWYLEPLQRGLSTQADVLPIVIADGEDQKSLTTLEYIVSQLLANNIRRNATIVALGGGVVGDLAGFVAATYQRGVKFIQIPTTLLAMVDSSVGGKTAVNHALGKNMIGAFYQPQAVLIDPDVMKTLPEREFSAGLAEVIKYGLIADEIFYQWLQDSLEAIQQHRSEQLTYLIQRCCELKAEIVSQDETEQGIRAILNYGHTFAHAIEQIVGYGKILHGEAVAIGMCMAMALSVKLGELSQSHLQALQKWLQQMGLPTELPAACKMKEVVEVMRRDKKNISDQIRLIMLDKIGQARVRDDIAKNILST